MVRKLDPNQCSWADIRCPNCHSANVIKLETKSGCVDCKLLEIARDYEISACPNSIHLVSSKSIQQRFICRTYGYKWTEVRRVI